MAVVPRGLGLVAALAVSGTALFFVYGYNKKKAFVNIRRGKGSWKLEYHYGGAAIQQQQQPVLTQESGVCLELREGEEIPIGEVQWDQLPWFRKAIQRLPQGQPSFLLLPASSSSGAELVSEGSRELEKSLKDMLVKYEVDVAQVNAFHETLLNYTVEEQQQELREHVTNFATVSPSASGVSQSDFLGRLDRSDNISEEPSTSHDCITEERSETDSLTLPESSASSGEDDSYSKALFSSAASSSPASKTVTLVGCFIRPGSGKTASKPKKVVRFSPSVVEPSSNNQDYRSRCKAQIEQRAAPHQRTHVPPAHHAIRPLAYDRPRLYSQAAKQTISYSPHRYRGRSYY